MQRAHIYMLRNVNDDGGGKFETCGLTSSKQTQWKPRLSFYYVATVLSLLGHTRLSHLKEESDLYVGYFDADPSERLSQTSASRVLVIWLGSVTGAHRQVSVQVGSGSIQASPVTLVQLVANSTVGKQSALQVALDGTISVNATEKPVLVLVGAAPQPMSGPVPPIDAPIPYVCKRHDGSALGPGLFCDGNGSQPSSSYRVCPAGARESCPNGEVCIQNGTDVACKRNDASECAGKDIGLYCSTSKPSPLWPDAYVECPACAIFYCPSETPKCVQNRSHVDCVTQ
eukprot:COSAG01_NODE_2460_length_7655_cov_15.411858_2_plen_285_part_00